MQSLFLWVRHTCTQISQLINSDLGLHIATLSEAKMSVSRRRRRRRRQRPRQRTDDEAATAENKQEKLSVIKLATTGSPLIFERLGGL